jgi:hypothetical protein
MKKKKKYQEMTTDELQEATKQFDQPMVAMKARPLTPKEQQLWERARRKPGRPRQGSGVQVISVSVEKELLAQSDALARKMHLTRASLIARGLKAVLAVEGVRS